MPFHSVINTFVFAVYFSRSVYGNEVGGSAAWAYAVGIAGFAIAIASPIFGAIADHGGRRKLWLAAFTLLNIVAMAGLWFVKPEQHSIELALVLIALASVGSEIALVFYNAMLPGLAPEKRLGRLSGFGWGMGYLGGLVALGLVLVALVLPDHPWFGIPTHDAINIRITALLSAAWAVMFAWPVFAFVPETRKQNAGIRRAVREGLTQLWATLKTLPRTPTLMWFLIASALYRDALTTLFTVGGQYAAGTFGMDTAHILYFAIGINLSAIAGCFVLSWLDDSIGSKTVIVISLIGLLVTGAILVMLHDKSLFIPIALVMGIFMGPAQSSGRALMARLSPPDLMNEMFGLYQLTGKSAAFIGPLAFATATTMVGNQRAGMATILVFIAGGLALMARVKSVPPKD
jgi:UMF1 family MFS transporter